MPLISVIRSIQNSAAPGQSQCHEPLTFGNRPSFHVADFSHLDVPGRFTLSIAQAQSPVSPVERRGRRGESEAHVRAAVAPFPGLRLIDSINARSASSGAGPGTAQHRLDSAGQSLLSSITLRSDAAAQLVESGGTTAMPHLQGDHLEPPRSVETWRTADQLSFRAQAVSRTGTGAAPSHAGPRTGIAVQLTR